MTAPLTGPPRKALFVSFAGSLYGAEHSLIDVVRQMDRTRWDLHFVVPNPGPFVDRLSSFGYQVTVFNARSGLGQGKLREARTALALARLIRGSNAELVHLNLHFAWPIVSAACLLEGVPLVVHVRNMIGPERRSLIDRVLFGRIGSLICISDAVRERLLECQLGKHTRADRITVIPDGRDLAPFQRGNRMTVRAELGLADTTPLIGMIARLEPMKGQDIFLESARLVAERLPDARFVLVGDVPHESRQPYREQLERLAAEPPLAGKVTFLGYRTDIPDILAALDCFAHSSRRGAFVSVLIEAMAAGIPIVATDVDGIPECVGRDGAAELLPNLEPGAFADAILRVVTEPARAASMGRLGKTRASARFDIAPLARATEQVFAQALVTAGSTR